MTGGKEGWFCGSPDGELYEMCFPTIAELIEDWRNCHGLTETWLADSGKPCGIPSELADVVIRLADLCGAHGIVPADIVTPTEHAIVGGDLLEQTEQLQRVLMHLAADNAREFNAALALDWCYSFALLHGIDLAGAIETKLAFNATRPARHGGKRA